MMDMHSFTAFLGWCTVINIGVIVLVVILMATMKHCVSGLHCKLFGVNQPDMLVEYARWTGNYKLLVLVFNLVPYAALKVMMM